MNISEVKFIHRKFIVVKIIKKIHFTQNKPNEANAGDNRTINKKFKAKIKKAIVKKIPLY